MKAVSVIIPAYNRASVIERAIDSVIAQTFDDLEIIVIDDGSTDNTEEIVKSISDERIRYIRCETNRGPGATRNEGLKIAQGKYIAFLDSDDEWLPEKIEKQVALMESLPEEWGVCHTGAHIIKDGSITVTHRPNPSLNGQVFQQYLCNKIESLMTPTVIIRKICVDHVGLFDERLWRGEDAEFFLRIFNLYKLAVLPDALATVHLQTIKSFDSRFESSRLIILEKHEAEIRNKLGWYAARRFRGNTFWLIADAKFRGRELKSGMKYFLRALASFPLMTPARYARMLLAASGSTNIIKYARCTLWKVKEFNSHAR